MIKRILSLLFLVIAVNSASFNCDKATTAVEKAICANKELGEHDEFLAKVYKTLRNSLDAKGREVLKREQLAWITWRDKEFLKSGNSIDTLIMLYNDRFLTLDYNYLHPKEFCGTYYYYHPIAMFDPETDSLVSVKGEDEVTLKALSWDEIAFSIETISTNAHSCSLEGVAKRNEWGVYEWENGENPPCRVEISLGAESDIFINTPSTENCKNYCGLHGNIDNYTFDIIERNLKK